VAAAVGRKTDLITRASYNNIFSVCAR